jgi:hypothetical protein
MISRHVRFFLFRLTHKQQIDLSRIVIKLIKLVTWQHLPDRLPFHANMNESGYIDRVAQNETSICTERHPSIYTADEDDYCWEHTFCKHDTMKAPAICFCRLKLGCMLQVSLGPEPRSITPTPSPTPPWLQRHTHTTRNTTCIQIQFLFVWLRKMTTGGL